MLSALIIHPIPKGVFQRCTLCLKRGESLTYTIGKSLTCTIGETLTCFEV